MKSNLEKNLPYLREFHIWFEEFCYVFKCFLIQAILTKRDGTQVPEYGRTFPSRVDLNCNIDKNNIQSTRPNQWKEWTENKLFLLNKTHRQQRKISE